MKKLLLAAACGLALAACSSEPARTPPLQLDYSSLGKIYLNVQDVNVINRSAGTPTKRPYIGHLFQPRLADAVTRWAQDRLQVNGSPGHATVIIKEASVAEYPLTVPSGFESWYTREQASKYVGRMELSIEAQSPVNSTVGSANAHATYAVTLPEKPTEAEKYAAYRDVLDNLMKDINQKLEQAMREHMGPFMASGPSASEMAPAPAASASPRVQQAPSDAEPEPLPPATISPARQPWIR